MLKVATRRIAASVDELTSSLAGAEQLESEMSFTETSTSNVGSSWDRVAVSYQNAARLPLNVATYGPGVGSEADFKLLGQVQGKRVLDLGCGGGQNAIVFAREGAISIGVDISVQQLAFAKRLLEQEAVKVEFRHGDLAELAFQRADTVDVVFSTFAFQYVPDINRVFRQVHRVLKANGLFVFSVPHPVRYVVGDSSTRTTLEPQVNLDPQKVQRSYDDKSPIRSQAKDAFFVEHPHTVSDVMMGLLRSGFEVDTVLEPMGDDNNELPRALVVRARKRA